MMIHYLQKAAENFVQHQIREPYSISKKEDSLRTVIAYIDTEHEDSKIIRAFVCVEESLLKKITELLLMEEVDDKETLCEMALETSNLIIGSAKVLADDSDDSKFTISTPHQCTKELGEYDDFFTLEIADSFMSVYTKEL